MGRRFGALLLCAACGRLGFDPSNITTSDGAADDGDGSVEAHDEDGDGISDGADVCPFVPDPGQADTDGDRVGDICDTAPTLPNQYWLAFMPMTGDLPAGWQRSGMWSQANDEWTFVDHAGQNQFLLPTPPGNLDIWIGLDITAVTGAGAQLAIVSRRTTGVYYYGELFGDTSSARAQIINYDGANYITLDSMQLASYPTGAVTIFFSSRATGSPLFTFAAGVGAMTYSASAATPSYNGADLLIIALSNLNGSVRYVAVAGS